MLNVLKNRSLILSFFLFVSVSILAQQPNSRDAGMKIGRLYGKVIDGTSKQPLAYATVMVVRTLPDGRDSLIEGSLTQDNGEFNITDLPMGPLTVKINYIGNKDIIKKVKIAPPNNVEQDLGDLAMQLDAQVLSTVEITAEKVSTMISLEKRVFNVDKNITAAGGTAEDILKNVPSVTVDMDGSVKLRDKGTTIYVDGKPSLMSLNQIPSDQIESVEVISNPSAKYEAATTGGIVNIVMKKNRKPGYNGSVSFGVGSQDRYNGAVNLNTNEGKWSLSGFYSFNTANVPTNGYLYRSNTRTNGDLLGYFNQNSDVEFKTAFHTARLNVDYSLNNRNTLSLSGSLNRGLFDNMTTQNFEYLSASQNKTEYGIRKTTSENVFLRNNVETQWRKTFAKKNKSLIAIANYSWGDGSNMADWNTNTYDAEGNLMPNNPELVDINGANTSGQGLFQLDYVNPINDSTKLEMGIRSFLSLRDQNYFFSPFDYQSDKYVLDTEFSQDTKITESINAAYITYSGKLKNQISYQAGLRFEQSDMSGKTRLEGTNDFGYSYPKGNVKDLMRSLFPALYISKKVSETTELGLNFSRKIQRPNFRQLMPGIQSNDRQNITIGNPNLQPEFINLAELNLNKVFGSNNWLATIYFSNETNTLKPLIQPSLTDPDVLITTFVNGENEITYGMDNTLRLTFGKNLDIMLNANVFKFNVTVDTFTNAGSAANAKASINYRLPSNFSIQLNGGYEGNRPIPQGSRQGIAFADFALKKSFFKNVANVTFSVSDIFNSRKDITIYTQPTYIQESMRRRETRFFRVTVQIPFGKADGSLFKKSNKRPEGQEMPDFGGS
ncbi:MAG: TonB-dependent receptor [Saprospiraceae bacterium]|nr:TonB-dependent receptor [Saprospiraceae bacterium]